MLLIQRGKDKSLDNISDIAALRKWSGVPEDTREKLLKNVFFGNCGVTTIALGYTITYKKGLGILLNGKCVKCGHDVLQTSMLRRTIFLFKDKKGRNK